MEQNNQEYCGTIVDIFNHDKSEIVYTVLYKEYPDSDDEFIRTSSDGSGEIVVERYIL